MTNYAAEHLPEWLDPLADEANVETQPIVSLQQIEIAGRRVLGEPLTAQRIMQNHEGLALLAGDIACQRLLQCSCRWLHQSRNRP